MWKSNFGILHEQLWYQFPGGQIKGNKVIVFWGKRVFLAFEDVYGRAVEGLAKISWGIPAGRRIVMA